MNSSVYVFGNLGNGYTQYPDDYAKEIYQSFYAKATANSQILIHRDNNLMYYGYIRKLDETSQYIGFCILLNDIMFSQIGRLFPVFENAIADLVSRGEILTFNDNGNIVSRLSKLNEKQQEVERITTIISNDIIEFENNANKLPPVSFGIANNESKKFSVIDKNSEIIEASAKYGYTCVFKDEDYDTVRINSYKGILSRLSGENKVLKEKNLELQKENKKVLHQKKQYRYVMALMILILFCGVGLYFLNSNLENTKANLEQANVTINNKENDIATLNNNVKNLRNNLAEEKDIRVKAENDFTEFKVFLSGIQPLIIKKTSFNFDTGWLSFDYYGLDDILVTLDVKAFNGDEYYSNSTNMAVEKGHNKFSVYLSDELYRSNWYSFELLIGDKIIGGGRH